MNLREPYGAVFVTVMTVLILCVAPRPAAAYLDPASGSIILQVVVAAVAAAAVTLRAFWGRIRMSFSKRPPETGNSLLDE